MTDDNKKRKLLVDIPSELRSKNSTQIKSMTGSMSAELAAEEAQRYAESIVETVREPLLVLDADLKIISANRNFYRTFKVIPSETLGCFIYDLGNNQWDIPKLRELLEEVLPEKEAFDDFEVDHDFQDIGHKIMLLNARRIYRKDIGAKMILLAIEDITERKRLESLLKESENRYRRVFETASDGIVFFEQREGRITHANPATEKLLGYTEKEIIGSKLQDIGITLDMGDFQTTLQNLNKSGILNYRNVEIETKSGQHIDTEIYLVDRAKLVQCNIRDITERKRAKEALRESEERYRELVENAPAGIYEVDYETNRFTSVNDVICEYTGYTRDELLAMNLFTLLTEESQKLMFARLEKLMAGETIPPAVEYGIRTKGGEELWVLLNARYIYEAGKLKGSRGVIHNITERKRVENTLRKSEEWFRKIFEEAHQVGIIIASPSFVFEKANPTFCRMMGYSADELYSMTFANITHPDNLKQDMESVKKVERGEIPFYQTEKRYIKKNGEVIWGNLIVSSIRDEHDVLQHYLSMVIDITEQKKAMELLLEANIKYQELADSISDVFFAMDKNLRYTYWNKASEKLTGIPTEKALGKSLMEIFPDNEARKQAKDMYLLTIETKKPQNLIVNYPGGEHIVHEISSYPAKEGVSVFVKDITERKQAERQLQETLESLRKSFSATIQVMVSAVEARDPYTSGHQTRSADLASAIAKEMGFSPEKIEGIRMAGSIHDIGKLSIPAEILSKPTKLSEIEFALIKEHAHKGFEMLKDVESPWPLAEIVLQHHERMDGSGYPRNLKGDDILIEARILAVVDVVEAMASHRPYRPSLGIDAALNEIEKNRKTIYDTAVADACLRLFREKGFQLAGA